MNNNYINNGPIKKEKSLNTIPILIIIIIVGIIAFGGYYIYQHKDELEITDIIPWDDEEDKKEENKKESSNNSKLTIPSLNKAAVNVDEHLIKILEITADDKGYIITLGLTCNRTEKCTMTVNEVLIDGYYVSTTFSVTDYSDIERTPTEIQFRINQSELDNLEITAFKNITLFYYFEATDMDEKDKKALHCNSFTFNNTIPIDNTKKGLLNVDTKGTTTIKYYKILKTSDYTYIYFDVKNTNVWNYQTIMIKKLLINDRIYEMPKFEEKIYNSAEHLVYIKIPTDKIEEVKKITISFFIFEKDENNNNTKIYITNEFSKKF